MHKFGCLFKAHCPNIQKSTVQKNTKKKNNKGGNLGCGEYLEQDLPFQIFQRIVKAPFQKQMSL